MKHLPLQEDERMEAAEMVEARQTVADARIRLDEKSISMAYTAFLG